MYLFTAEHYPDPTGALACSRVIAEPRYPSDREWPMVYICSPFAGDTDRNQKLARMYCRFALESGYMPIAPHLLFPQFMNDRDPLEREIALVFCKVLVSCCRQVWVFGDRITEGMAEEIRKGRKRSKLIRYFTTEREEVLRDD